MLQVKLRYRPNDQHCVSIVNPVTVTSNGVSPMSLCRIIWAVCITGVHTGGVSAATHVILHRWQDTMPSRQQELPEIEEEERKSDGGWERVITKRDDMKENLKGKK